MKHSAANKRIGNMAGLTEMPLGGSNAIGLWFGQKEYNSAFVIT
jgi:hypothetical protein